MKAYKIEILVIDHDEVGKDNIVNYLENARFANDCLSLDVKDVVEKDIGQWTDNHPLNNFATYRKEYERLFRNI